MDSRPGTYVLVFGLDTDISASVGSLGEISLDAGYYAYVGSAFGPGGLKARTGRHRKMSKHTKWHIDHVRPYLTLHEIWYAIDEKVECSWANQMVAMSSELPANGFGSSDCRCNAHFFKFAKSPSFNAFRALVPQMVLRDVVERKFD